MIREVMESAGLEGFAEIGIILFLFAFVLVLIRVFLMKKSEVEVKKNIPFEDDPTEADGEQHT